MEPKNTVVKLTTVGTRLVWERSPAALLRLGRRAVDAGEVVVVRVVRVRRAARAVLVRARAGARRGL